MKKTAIILGATGLTGSILLDLLLKDTRYEKIKLFSRSSVDISNPKIEEHLIDLFELEKHKKDFQADEVFCCIGTTKAKTPDNETYRKIDYGIPFSAAKLCKEKNINTYIVISAMGANPDSKVFYNKTKGEMERDVIKQNIQNTFILQPGLISGERDEKRLGESIAKFFFNILNPIIPKKYRSISPETIAKSMVVIANQGFSHTRIENQIIKEIAKNA
ncbi:NAD(P)H-binding protein [uncultured Planktosalinus sp.]|uniref:NAD(P)H-binding protein n=1 Tax=uncultured Planktosalinus sp. TaxID=1810935 RepID=UPI0030D7A9BE